MALGKQIKHYREKAGWKLKELSARADVDIGTLSALEVRDSSRSEFFQPIAAAFGLTLEQLADESTNHTLALQPNGHFDQKPQPKQPRGGYSAFAAMLAKTFDTLPEDLEIRASAFTECLGVLKRAGVSQQSSPPVPAPSLPATSKTQF